MPIVLSTYGEWNYLLVSHEMQYSPSSSRTLVERIKRDHSNIKDAVPLSRVRLQLVHYFVDGRFLVSGARNYVLVIR